jgi:hypothetical protein
LFSGRKVGRGREKCPGNPCFVFREFGVCISHRGKKTAAGRRCAPLSAHAHPRYACPVLSAFCALNSEVEGRVFVLSTIFFLFEQHSACRDLEQSYPQFVCDSVWRRQQAAGGSGLWSMGWELLDGLEVVIGS